MMHTILLILVVIALLSAALSFTGRPWGLQGAVILLAVVMLIQFAGGAKARVLSHSSPDDGVTMRAP